MLCLSAVFSIVFYHTSTSSLTIHVHGKTSAPSGGTYLGSVGIAGSKPHVLSSTNASNLDAQLAEQTGVIRQHLIHQLLLLNAGVLIVGMAVSYMLARATLRPIERNVADQLRFASDASHELRTPLAGIRAQAEVALRNPTFDPTETSDALQAIVKQTVHLQGLSEHLLQLSKAAVPAAALEITELNVETMLTNMADDYQHAAARKKIHISQNVDSQLRLKTNLQSVKHLLSILIDNAVKYTPPGGGVTLSAHAKDSYIIIAVHNTGPGIAKQDMPHVFERFYRGDPARTGQTPGYGLGLSIAQKLAGLLGARLTVASSLKSGTTFSVQLPRR
jgi:signal transduction histidine kinase